MDLAFVATEHFWWSVVGGPGLALWLAPPEGETWAADRKAYKRQKLEKWECSGVSFRPTPQDPPGEASRDLGGYRTKLPRDINFFRHSKRR